MTGDSNGTSRQDRNGTPRVRSARKIHDVTVGRDAIRTAWRYVQILDGPTEGKSMAAVAVEVREAIDDAGRQEVSRGMVTLLGLLIGSVTTSMDDGPLTMTLSAHCCHRCCVCSARHTHGCPLPSCLCWQARSPQLLSAKT